MKSEDMRNLAFARASSQPKRYLEKSDVFLAPSLRMQSASLRDMTAHTMTANSKASVSAEVRP